MVYYPVTTVVEASGDITGGTDTAALQAALNAVPLNGGTVQLASGVFYLNASLNPTVSGTIIEGSGWGTQLRYDGTVVTGGAIAMADTTTRRVFIRDLRVSQTNATASGTGIEASYFQNSALERLLIDGGGASGVPPLIGVSFNSATTFYNVLSDSRVNASGANSIVVRFDTGANSNVVRNCRILPDTSSSSGTGVYVNSRSIDLDHIDCENAAGTGISLGSTGHGCTILAPYLEANATNLLLASGVNCPTVIGGTIENGSTADITDNGALNPKYINLRSSVGGEHSVTKAIIGDVWQPEDSGLISWAYDPAAISNSSALTAGTAYFVRVPVRYATTITKLWIDIATAATSITAGQNWVGLYTIGATTATLQQQAAGDTIFASTGVQSVTITGTAVTAGYVLVGFFFNGTGTALALGRNAAAPSIGNIGLATAGLRFFSNTTLNTTTLPSTITLSGNSVANAGTQDYWAGAG